MNGICHALGQAMWVNHTIAMVVPSLRFLAVLVQDGPYAYQLTVISSGLLLLALGVSLLLFSHAKITGKDALQSLAQMLITVFALATAGIVAAAASLVLSAVIGAIYGGMLGAACGSTIGGSSSLLFQGSAATSHRRLQVGGSVFITVAVIVISAQIAVAVVAPWLP